MTRDLFDNLPQSLIRQGLSIVPPPDLFAPHPLDGAQKVWVNGELIWPKSHRNDPQTSTDAAQSMTDVSRQHRVQCLTALALYGPMTADEVALKCGFNHRSIAARRLTELDQAQAIERIETGTYDGKVIYQTRKTASGRAACVYRVKRT